MFNNIVRCVSLGDLLNLTPLDTSGRHVTRPRRRFSLREGNRTVRPTDRRSKMISAPTNFNHISHMGPGNGIQVDKSLKHSLINAAVTLYAIYNM